MTTTSTCKKLSLLAIVIMTLTSCGSAEIIPTKDVCHLIRHDEDDLYQVKINDDLINKRWYLKEDAIVIAEDLHKKNLCTSRYQIRK